MKAWIMAALAAATIAAPAGAQVLYSNNFDAENGGATTLNYTGFNGLSVTSGSVDLVHTGDGFNIACAGGAGGCVDLDGTTNAAGLLSSGTYALATGNRYTLGLSLSGNQRVATTDGVQFGFNFGQATSGIYNFVTTSGAAFSGTFQNQTYFQFYGTGFPSNFPFDDIQFTIQALNGGTFGFYINGSSLDPAGDSNNDNIGMILDNVSLTQSAVPEPATWALMILGFGAVGGALRRRRATAVRFA